jgi:hypothetical protein
MLMAVKSGMVLGLLTRHAVLFAKLHNPMNNLTAKTEGSHKPRWNAQAGVPV